MATSHLKELAKYSDDALNYIIDKLPEDERASFTETLRTLSVKLGKKKPVRKNKKHHIPNAETLFLNDVVKSIRDNLNEFESRDEQDRGGVIDLLLDFPVDFGNMNLKEQIEVHSKILKIETNTQIFQNVLKFYKGCLYYEMKKNHDGKKTIREWFHDVLGIAYSTVTRYIHVYFFGIQYPRILACLSYAQLQKHHTRIIDYLSKNPELASRLNTDLSFLSNGQEVIIRSVNDLNVTLPKNAFWMLMKN